MTRTVLQRQFPRAKLSDTPWSDLEDGRHGSQWQGEWATSVNLQDTTPRLRKLLIVLPCLIMIFTAVLALNASVLIAQATSFMVEWICMLFLIGYMLLVLGFLVLELSRIVTLLSRDTQTDLFDNALEKDADDYNDIGHRHCQANDLRSDRSHARHDEMSADDLDVTYINTRSQDDTLADAAKDITEAEALITWRRVKIGGSNGVATVRTAHDFKNRSHVGMVPTPAELEAIVTEAKLDAIRADDPGLRG